MSVCDFTSIFECFFQVFVIDTGVDDQVLAIPCSSTKADETKVRTEETITISNGGLPDFSSYLQL